MTVFPFQINEVRQLYDRISKIKQSAVPEQDQGGPQDIVSISLEGKKRRVLDQARTEVIDQTEKT